ncbi:hypothetical protein F5146DRAFT_997921 [Armillaria mellea]|nr:hypothetical protein F5146DRAFT_997921 [Armillaria mellea]
MSALRTPSDAFLDEPCGKWSLPCLSLLQRFVGLSARTASTLPSIVLTLTTPDLVLVLTPLATDLGHVPGSLKNSTETSLQLGDIIKHSYSVSPRGAVKWTGNEPTINVNRTGAPYLPPSSRSYFFLVGTIGIYAMPEMSASITPWFGFTYNICRPWPGLLVFFPVRHTEQPLTASRAFERSLCNTALGTYLAQISLMRFLWFGPSCRSLTATPQIRPNTIRQLSIQRPDLLYENFSLNSTTTVWPSTHMQWDCDWRIAKACGFFDPVYPGIRLVHGEVKFSVSSFQYVAASIDF